jgi:putative nucleotidyltransferase with HDIG domain
MALLSGSFTVKVPSVPATISVSETFVFSCALLFGTPAATITVALDALVMSLWRRRRDTTRILFNIAEPALSIWFASQLYFLLVPSGPLARQSIDLTLLLIPLLALTCSYFLLNSWLTAIAVSFDSGQPVISLWKTHFLPLALNYFVGASVAALLVQNTEFISLATLGVILPLLIISYLTFKTSMGRVEDANRHLAELNHLYVSTIETLAMAIDARDQITHGHIRRVQAIASSLARALKITDPSLLRAIEAAALLHDMGKLAVPDHILKKPGPLTAAEYAEMQRHPNIGADILAAVNFPYPVVPIVRHHHECWDGTGYPDGLAGAAIPIGARILAVVDCYDALTSDRPYRPRLSGEQAVRIIEQRKGTMYDPAVVEAFLANFAELTGVLPATLSTDNTPHLPQATHVGEIAPDFT